MIVGLIKKACDELGFSYHDIDLANVFLRINFDNEKFHLCIANNLGLNDEVVEKICRDKEYVHSLLSKYVSMPKSLTYIDSNPPDLYAEFSKFDSHEAIVNHIVKNTQFPIIVKPNSKSMGVNVFLCHQVDDLAKAVDTIFDKNSFLYDHVLLVQERISIQKEFRVIVYDSEIQFVYQKDNTGNHAEFIGNLSPLHFSNARAVLLKKETDMQILDNLSAFISPIFKQMKLNYAGLDIVLDTDGSLYLLEINTKPGFTYFIRDNGEHRVIELIKKILLDLAKKNDN